MRFFKLTPDGPDPALPPDQLNGEIPLRAYQHCEPFLAANRSGWLLYPPVDFELVWTGHEALAKFDGIDSWIKVDKLFLPGYADYWREAAPGAALEMMPPFLEAFPERGVVQAWTGFAVETDPDVSAWIRAPVNRWGPSAYQVLEGIIETDWWMGPLLTNFQFVKTDDPVRFERTRPWLQVVEVPRQLHVPRPDARPEVIAQSAMPEAAWAKFMATSDRRNSGRRGTYRIASRRRAAADETPG